MSAEFIPVTTDIHTTPGGEKTAALSAVRNNPPGNKIEKGFPFVKGGVPHLVTALDFFEYSTLQKCKVLF